ncbi:glycoside hydrolase family 26 protein [Leucogyrophana mollusca]|uniref:Glycoside hydrolase family 26 protein n=1 Tax=Leucogyrophana mollusca TaxID=85980 RepID=A0ACB8BE32_9AGAM|nr:glycoside hydrolase family 26 protein [Leucogyrophana mollusca]
MITNSIPLLSFVGLALLAGVVCTQTIVLEAEDGTFTGNVVVDTSIPGFSGTGYVSGFSATADSVTVSTDVAAAGLYDLTVAYLSLYGEKKAYLTLNGSPSGELDLTSTTWANVSAGQVLLNAGTNTVGIQDDWGYYSIDAFYLSPALPPPPHQATAPPVNANATPEAKSLLKYIQQHYASSDLLSGQQDTDSITWLQQNAGKSPAIGGFDFMDYSPSRIPFGATSNATEQAIAWDAQGGIVTFVWHWNAPTDLLNTPEEPWYSGFYTAATTFNISEALADPTGNDYQLVLRDLDAIAVQLQRLSDANIPVLFRFLHEAEGGWFWWGAQGPDAAKALFRLGYDRFTNYHGLNNIIWVWNSVQSSWYPGDDVTDILSYDSYPAVGDHGPVSNVFNELIVLGQDQKVVALAEVGSIPDPTLTRAYYADWAYFVTWGGDYITDNTSNPLPFLIQVYNDPQVITLDKVGDFKHLP